MPLPVYPPRAVYLECPNYIGRTVSFTDGASGVPFQIGTVPVGSVFTVVFAAIDTAFNAGTTNTISIGTTFANANELMQVGDNTPGTPGYYAATRGLGNTLTQTASLPTTFPGQSAQDTTEGGVGIWVKIGGTGTPATTGHARVGVVFIPPPGA